MGMGGLYFYISQRLVKMSFEMRLPLLDLRLLLISRYLQVIEDAAR